MKMKRFFTNKNKKKKITSNSEECYDQKISDASGSTLPGNIYDNKHLKQINKKKQRNQRKKSKGKNTEQNPVDHAIDSNLTNLAGTYCSPNGTKVVLRRASDTLDGDSSYSRPFVVSKSRDNRIPGSESSSRTASSASSSSSARWSARRPWSLVESLRGQNLSGFSELQESDGDNLSDQHNLTVSTICTLPRGSSLLDDVSSADELDRDGRNRSLFLDTFFRHFRRSTLSTRASSHRSLSASLSSPPPPPHDHDIFQSKDTSKRKKNKKKRRSSHTITSTPATRDTASAHSMSCRSSDDVNGRRLPSATESLIFDPVEDAIPEEQGSLISTINSRTSSLSHSNSSSVSTNTMITASELSSKTEATSKLSSPTNDDSMHSAYSNRSSMLELSSDRDEVFKLQSGGSQHLNCRCYRTSSGTKVTIVDTDTAVTYVDSRCRMQNFSSHSAYNTPCSRTSSVDTETTQSMGDICDAESYTTASSVTVESNFTLGGSLNCLADKPKSSSKTLPARRCLADDAQFKVQSPANMMMYASLPQLSHTDRRSLTDVEGTQKETKERPKSSTVKVCASESKMAIDPRSSSQTRSVKRDSNVVDSPIKRAIGYPGVVLRHRRFKKSNSDQMSKSLSGTTLTGERRAKQVMSLNMEDLPTYDEMRGDPRWRLSAVSTKDIRRSTDTGRARLRAAVLHHRYASLCTSVDNVSAMESLLGNEQSLEELNNMDDDEFLNLYLSAPSTNTSGGDSNRSSQSQEQSSKRVNALRKSVASLANLISPGKPSRSKLQRSSSFKEGQGFKYRPPGSSGGGVSGSSNTPRRRGHNNPSNKNRCSKLWSETFDHSGLEEAEVKRQEAIFELYQGECVMVQDLKMAKQTYRDSMVTLKMLSDEEVTRIFGKLDCLLPLHEDLLARLEKGRNKDGRTEGVGHVFIDWFPTLSPYNEYCANQADAKETLDAVVSREGRVRDFLQRCLESPFSRKLDLWSYLDLPRSRLVKYPLLLKAILKVTPADHKEAPLLEKALTIINDIIVRVDELTGERQTRFVQKKLEYLDDKHKCSEVEESKKIICSGQLRNGRGTKLHVFLFDLALVLTRNATRGDKLTYQVYRQPIPLRSLVVEAEESGKLSGSFRGGILSNDKAKHSFRVKNDELNTSYTLIATDEHDKKQWVNSLRECISRCQPQTSSLSVVESPLSRRTASAKSFERPTEEVKVTSIKRSSSMKSDSGSGSWYRSRSMTTHQSLFRRSSKEKKSMLSPLVLRRNSKSQATDESKSPDLSIEALPKLEKSACRRSRSLNSSPIAFLANLPKKNQRTNSGLVRSESCKTKPPSGKYQLFPHSYNLRSSSRTPPRSPMLSATRSIPDLTSYGRHGSIDGSISLDDVKKRLAPRSEENLEDKENDASSNVNVHKYPHLSAVSHLVIDSPDHPAASNTSQNFPIVEEESLSPLYMSATTMSLHSSSSSPSMSFHSPPGSLPIIAWARKSSTSKEMKADHGTSSSSSTESLSDVSPLLDDVATILDGAANDLGKDEHDVTPTNETVSAHDVVAETINDVINSVCDVLSVAPYSDGLAASCHDNYITITADDGLPWRGNDVEMTV